MFGKRPLSGSSDTAVAERQSPSPRPSAPPPAAEGSEATAEAGRTPFPSAGLGAPIIGAPTEAAVGRTEFAAAAGPLRRRFAPLGVLLRGQGHDLRRADRGDRSRPAGQARHQFGARGDSRHRQRDRRDQEHRDVDLRAGGPARRHLQRRPRLRAARAVARPRRDRRHHGERLGHGLHRSRRQDSENRDPLPRQPAAPEYLPAHRQPDRPPGR